MESVHSSLNWVSTTYPSKDPAKPEKAKQVWRLMERRRVVAKITVLADQLFFEWKTKASGGWAASLEEAIKAAEAAI